MVDNDTPDAGTFKPLNQIGAASPSAAPTPSSPAPEGVTPASLLGAGADAETPDAGSFVPLDKIKPTGTAATDEGEQGKGDQPDQPGFVQRLMENSGAEGIGHLIGKSAGYYGTMPIRTYHRVQGLEQAYAALKAGDLKKATMIAHTLASGPDDPITAMAKNLLKIPFDEATEAYKSFQNNPDKVGAALTAAQHGIRSIPLIGAAAEQIGHTIADDLHSNNWSGLSGDLVGIVPALLMGSEGKAAEAAEASTAEGASEAAAYAKKSAIRPSQRMIGRTPVPVTALQGENVSRTASGLQKIANNPAAEQAAFAAERTQPAAVNATVSNLEDVARNHIQAVRDQLGTQTPFEEDMSTLRKQSGAMKDAAQEIYQKFDDASNAEQQAYKDTQVAKKTAFDADQAAKEKAFNEAQDAKQEAFDKAQEAKKKAATPEKPYKPEKFKAEKFEGEEFEPDERPLSFREMQTKRAEALKAMREGTSPDAYKAARQELASTEQQMDEFAKRHQDVVAPEEYDLANETRRAAAKHDFIADKLNIDEGTDNIPASITKGSLKALPRSFDKAYGDGSFRSYLGPEGFKNYNMVRDVLENPETQNGLMHIAQLVTQHMTSSGLGAGTGYALAGKEGAMIGSMAGPVLRYTAGRIAENLLFNPEYGQTVMAAYRAALGVKAPLPVRSAAKVAPAAATLPRNASGVTHTWHPDTGITPVQ